MKILLPLVLLLLFASPVLGASLGMSPGTLNLDNVLRGGYAERLVTLTTNSPEPTGVTFEVEGPASDWITTDAENRTLQVSESEPLQVKVIAEPPDDIPIGDYDASIRFIADPSPTEQLEGRAGGFVRTAVTGQITLSLTGQQIVACRAGGFGVSDAEIGFPVDVKATIINDGNTRLTPTVRLDIWDQFQETLLLSRTASGDTLLPTTQDNQIIPVTSEGLAVGQYWANVVIEECGAGEKFTFSIVEPGQIADRGELISLRNKKAAEVGEPVSVIAQFENGGARSVTARFKGTARIDDQVVEVLESEQFTVGPGTRQDIEFFYTPESPGRHLISGRVHYNNKITFERGSILNVKPVGESTELAFLPLLLYVVMAITILFLVRLIVLGRKKRR